MSHIRFALLALMVHVQTAGLLWAQPRVVTNVSSVGFDYKDVPKPVLKDAAESAGFRLLEGSVDPNSRGLDALHDGRMPSTDDQPSENFFFTAGSKGGLIEVDLRKVIGVKQVATYSWHNATRGPQVYRLYGATGDESGFTRTVTKLSDPTLMGWTHIAKVDSTALAEMGEQHGVSITDGVKLLGRFRFLLFDISPTESHDPFGNTFFSEIDVYDADGPDPTAIQFPEVSLLSFTDDENKFHFTIDVTNAVDLREWTDSKLRPVIQKWYPKIVEMLPSENFKAPERVTFRFQEDRLMRGIPAYASRATITLNANWFRIELEREARGAVVHEMVHVAQGYSNSRRASQRQSTPGWIVEGIPDYVRWFLYEPESQGAQLKGHDLSKIRHDDSYRISGNFLDFLTRKYDKDIVLKLNAAVRQGRYSSEFWQATLNKSESELEAAWKADLLDQSSK